MTRGSILEYIRAVKRGIPRRSPVHPATRRSEDSQINQVKYPLSYLFICSRWVGKIPALRLRPVPDKTPSPTPNRSAEDAKIHNIVDMGLDFAVMLRVFEKRSKGRLKKQLLKYAKRIFSAKSEVAFKSIHDKFCDWGTKNIRLAKRGGPASYGQITKTLDAVLHVLIYYAYYPDCTKATKLLLYQKIQTAK